MEENGSNRLIDEFYSSVCEDGKYYLIDRTSRIITKHAQSHFTLYSTERILAHRNNKFGFIDTQDRIRIPFKYDEILFRGDDLFDVRIGLNWGVLNLEGIEITAIKYEVPIKFNYNNIAIVTDNLSKAKGVIDQNWKEIVPTIYSHIIDEIESHQLIYVAIEGLETNSITNFFSGTFAYATWGCYNVNGQLILPIKYDCIKISNGYILGGYGGSFLKDGSFESAFFPEYSGCYDMYSNVGVYLIGGFNLFNFESDYLFYHFGGGWVTIHDEYNYTSYEFKYHEGSWVGTDIKLNSLIKLNGEEFCIASNHKRIKFLFNHVEVKNSTKSIPSKTRIVEELSLPNEIQFSRNNYWNQRLYFDNIIIYGSRGSQDIIFAKEKIIVRKGFQYVEAMTNDLIYFQEGNSCGIMLLDNILVTPKYKFLSKPVDGYCFGAIQVTEDEYQCELIDLTKIESEPILVYKNITYREMSVCFSYEYLKLQQMVFPVIDRSLKNYGVRGVLDEKIEKDFLHLLSPTFSNYSGGKRYWFPDNDFNY